MNKLFIPLLLIAIALASTTESYGQWTRIVSIDAGAVRALASAGGVLYAGTDGGLFRSTDMGTRWESVTLDASTPIMAVRASGASVYAGSLAGDLFRTTDGGQSWMRFDTLPPGVGIRSIAVDNGDLYIATNAGLFVNRVGTIDVMPATMLGLGNASIWDIESTPSGIVAATYSGMFSTMHADSTWAAVGGDQQFVFVTQGFGNHQYAGTLAGLLVSNDNGLTWSPVGGAADSATFAITTAASRIFAGTSSGVLFADSSSPVWHNISEGLPGSPILALSADANNLYAGTADGEVFRRSLSNISDVPQDVAGASTQRLLIRSVSPTPALDRFEVHFQIPTASHVSISLVNALGEEVAVVADGDYPAGVQTAAYEIKGMASGMYVLILSDGNSVATQPLSIVR
jgi:photosystem II stability/assembly factor-like uncharacterized protein